MTGLDEKKDSILEVAALVTDSQLQVLERYHAVVYQPQSVLDGMNDWCKENHGASGLTAAVPFGVPLEKVETDLLSLIEKHFKKDERVVLAGNSIGNDRRFIDQYMPKFAEKLHYRMVDVSSFKEVYRETLGLTFQKSNAHRALGDIEASLAELKFYLSYVKI